MAALPRFRSALPVFALCVSFGQLLLGCTGPDRRPPPPGAAGETATSLRGEQLFLHGRIKVEATLSRRPFAGAGPRSESGGEPRHRRGREGHRGPPPSGGDYPADSGERAPRVTASHLPPVALRARLTNLSREPLDIYVTDLNSELGNFAVRPDHFTLDPGQVQELDPMYSQLGIPVGELPVTIAVRCAAATDRQVLLLRPEPAPPAEPGR